MDSRKHWPSLFKAKSSTSFGDQLNKTPNSSPTRTPYSEGSQKEKSPPKTRPRWNPKPEQIKILEDIFNSGKLNPTREEIKRIRAQLEEFGQIGDASVFYWFQNRKSRSKQKQRQPQAKPKPKSKAETGSPSANSVTSTASTSTSDQSKPSGDLVNSIKNNTGDQSSSSSVVPVSSFSGYHYDPQVNERMSNNQLSNMQAPVILNEGTAGVQDSLNVNRTITAFINDMPIDFPMGPINFRAFFGDDALLFDSAGQPVLVNEWGFTLQGLEHGAKYFLI